MCFASPHWSFVIRHFLILLLCITAASAQVEVHIDFKRSLYLRYEPIICTVSITNRTGNELDLSDTPVNKWFGFQIERTNGNPIPPLNPSYENQQVQIGPGQTLKRVINLTPIFPLSEFGTYRVRAAVFVPQLNRFFSSPFLNIEITEGRLLWQETVGVPEDAGLSGNSRIISLMAHRLPRTTMLYVRVEDRENGIIYCTHQLGRMVSFNDPEVQLDNRNQIHILHVLAPKAFFYSMIGLNGAVLKRAAYQDLGSRPVMVTKPDGSIEVVGGTLYDPDAPLPKLQLPSISDRPVPLPTPQTKPTPEDKRPVNLLSR